MVYSIAAMLVPLVLSAPNPPDDVVTVSATLQADRLEIGQSYSFVVEARFKDGWSASDSGIPKPFLQIKTPPSVQLDGKVLKTQRELSKNEYLREPFERLMQGNETTVRFTLVDEPGEDERIALNIIAYASDDPANDAWFIRKRMELPVRPGATAELINATESDWGTGDELQIGDQAELFELPRADGSKVSLEQYRGKKNVLVTTYRAFW
ncbi:MAG: hypothetical protein ACE5EQ_06025 [Phycisphaerae bacterium]